MSYDSRSMILQSNFSKKRAVHSIILAPIVDVETRDGADKLKMKHGEDERPLLDFGDVYMSSERAILRHVELYNGSNKDVTVKLSWHHLEDQNAAGYSMRIEFQLENPNLQYKYGTPKYNEALNLAGFVHECHVPTVGSTKMVVVCHPHVNSAKTKGRQRNLQRPKGIDDPSSVTLPPTTSTMSSMTLPTESFHVIEGEIIAEGGGVRSSILIRARVCNSVMTRCVVI